MVLNFLKWFMNAGEDCDKMSDTLVNEENVSPSPGPGAAEPVDDTAAAVPESQALASEPDAAGEDANAGAQEVQVKKRKRRTKAEMEEAKRLKAAQLHAKKLEKERKQLEKIAKKPPADVPSEEGEPSENEDEDEEEDEDDVRGFMGTLRDYMRVEIARSMKKYKTDPASAAVADEQAELERSAAVQLPPRSEPRKVQPGQYARNRPTIIFV